MRLIKELFQNISVSYFDKNQKNIRIAKLVVDSRKTKKGDLFIAQKGYHMDSHQYVLPLLQLGAYVLVNQEFIDTQKIPEIYHSQIFTVTSTETVIAPISKAYFDNPDHQLKVIGITGTNGKTSISYLLKNIFEQQGFKIGLIGTIQNIIDNQIIPSMNTTPNGFKLFHLLHQMVKKNCQIAILEVSSHALKLNRCLSLDLDVAIFTNLTQDHLDFHPHLEDYFESKLKIFDLLEKSKKNQKIAFYNGEIKYRYQIAHVLEKKNLVSQTFGIATDHYPYNITAMVQKMSLEETLFSVKTDQESFAVKTSLKGYFNIQNILAVIGCALFFDIPVPAIQNAFKNIHIKGRLENVTPNKDFIVFVDYAHTPDALQNILETSKALNPQRIIHVFGAGGDRDTSKRPIMGKIVSEYADILIITSDNPRSENPYVILEDIAQGISKSSHCQVYKIVNRKLAIHKALELTQKNDIVLISGKGHETYQIFKYQTIHFNDETVVKEYLNQ